MDLLSMSIGLINYFSPIIFVLFIVFLVALARKNSKKSFETTEKSFANQREMIGLLKEIRDSLKK